MVFPLIERVAEFGVPELVLQQVQSLLVHLSVLESIVVLDGEHPGLLVSCH